METLGKNLDYLMRKRRVRSLTALSRITEVSQSTLNRAYNGKVEETRASTLQPLADWSGYTVEQLRSIDLETQDREAALTDERGTVQVWQDAADLEPDENRIWLDRFDYQVSAGTGIVTWEVREKAKLPFSMAFFHQKRANPRNCKLIMVRGPSMEPYLFDHDLAMIDVSDVTVRDSEIYAVYYEDESFVKQIFKQPGGGLVLHSYNAAYRDIEISREQLEFVRIVGRLIYRSG